MPSPSVPFTRPPFHADAVDEYPGDRRIRLTRAAVDRDGHVWSAGTVGTVIASGYDNPVGAPYADLAIGPRIVTRFHAASQRSTAPAFLRWITWGAGRGTGPIRATHAAATQDAAADRALYARQGRRSDRAVYGVDLHGIVRDVATGESVIPTGHDRPLTVDR